MGVVNLDRSSRKVIGKSEYKRVYYYDIVTNPINRKDLRDIEALQVSIQENGLLHPLEVMEDLKTQTYRLLGGERRYTALQYLVSENLIDEMIPCMIYKDYEDPIIERLHMYQSNAHSAYNKEELKQACIDLSEAYDYLNKTGKRVEYIGGTLGISPRTVQKYLNEAKAARTSNIENESVENKVADLDKNYGNSDMKKDLKTLIKKFRSIEEKISNSSEIDDKAYNINIENMLKVLSDNFEQIELNLENY